MTSGEDGTRGFREVLGHYPTGVTIVTAISESGTPTGMVVGSFTSVSVDPPLVAFLPQRTSNSYARVRTAGSFCVNVLSADQENLCRQFAAKSGDKFSGVEWRPAGSGAPILGDAVAWVDCEFETTHEAGDHDIVIGRVLDLDAPKPGVPLLFFQGGYGGFAPRALVAPYETDLRHQLHTADVAREPMERLADEIGLQCYAQCVVGDEIVIVAGAGDQKSSVRAHIGRRLPFAPPYGALFTADEDDATVERWISRAHPEPDEETRATYRTMVRRVRARGWSMALREPEHADVWPTLDRFSVEPRTPRLDRRIGSALDTVRRGYEPEDLDPAQTHDVRLLCAPVYASDGSVAQVLALFGMPSAASVEQISTWRSRLRATAEEVTRAIGGIITKRS